MLPCSSYHHFYCLCGWDRASFQQSHHSVPIRIFQTRLKNFNKAKFLTFIPLISTHAHSTNPPLTTRISQVWTSNRRYVPDTRNRRIKKKHIEPPSSPAFYSVRLVWFPTLHTSYCEVRFGIFHFQKPALYTHIFFSHVINTIIIVDNRAISWLKFFPFFCIIFEAYGYSAVAEY